MMVVEMLHYVVSQCSAEELEHFWKGLHRDKAERDVEVVEGETQVGELGYYKAHITAFYPRLGILLSASVNADDSFTYKQRLNEMREEHYQLLQELVRGGKPISFLSQEVFVEIIKNQAIHAHTAQYIALKEELGKKILPPHPKVGLSKRWQDENLGERVGNVEKVSRENTQNIASLTKTVEKTVSCIENLSVQAQQGKVDVSSTEEDPRLTAALDRLAKVEQDAQAQGQIITALKNDLNEKDAEIKVLKKDLGKANEKIKELKEAIKRPTNPRIRPTNDTYERYES